LFANFFPNDATKRYIDAVTRDVIQPDERLQVIGETVPIDFVRNVRPANFLDALDSSRQRYVLYLDSSSVLLIP
jgi:hypothetical protein